LAATGTGRKEWVVWLIVVCTTVDTAHVEERNDPLLPLRDDMYTVHAQGAAHHADRIGVIDLFLELPDPRLQSIGNARAEDDTVPDHLNPYVGEVGLQPLLRLRAVLPPERGTDPAAQKKEALHASQRLFDR